MTKEQLFIKGLEVYLTSIIEQLKDEDKQYLRGYADAHKDILERIEDDEK